MPRTIFSKKAEADLAEIYRYGFVNFGEHQADQYADGLREKCQLLSENPLLYRMSSILLFVLDTMENI